MKKLFLLAFGLIVLNLAMAQTTEEEYQYLKHGYRAQVKNNLDMKKGYEMVEVKNWAVNYGEFQRQATFKQLYRMGDSKPCATLMILKRTDTGYEDYLCIPSDNSSEEMWKRAYNDFKEATMQWNEPARGYAWGMLRMISYLSTNNPKSGN